MLVYAILNQVSGGTNLLWLMEWTPFVHILLYLPALFMLCFAAGRDVQVGTVALLTFLIFNWTNQNYFSSQGIAYLQSLTILALAVTIAVAPLRSGRAQGSLLPPLILLVIALALTHLLTALFVAAALAILAIVRRHRELAVSSALIICAIGAWVLYGAVSALIQEGASYARSIFNFETYKQLILTARFQATSPEHRLLNQLRVAFSALLGILAVAGSLLFWARHRLSPTHVRGLVSMLAVAIAAPLGTASFPYGGELPIRLFFYLLPALTFFAAVLAQSHKLRLWLVILLAMLVPVHFLVHYGNELSEYVAPSEIQAALFFRDVARGGVRFVDLPFLGFEWLEEGVSTWNANDTSIEPSPEVVARVRPRYVALGRTVASQIRFFYGHPYHFARLIGYLDPNPRYLRIYDNDTSWIYVATQTD
jgi:hypothetical protein